MWIPATSRMRREAIFWFLFWRLYVFGHREVDALKVVEYYQNGVNIVILSNNALSHVSSNFQGYYQNYHFHTFPGCIISCILYSVILLAASANDLTIIGNGQKVLENGVCYRCPLLSQRKKNIFWVLGLKKNCIKCGKFTLMVLNSLKLMMARRANGMRAIPKKLAMKM